jgi:hypothetical protein
MTAFLVVCITTLIRIWNIEQIRNGVFARIAKLPRYLQWIAPVLIGVLIAGGQAFVDGSRGLTLLESALKGGGELGLLAIGFWHTYKRIGTK